MAIGPEIYVDGVVVVTEESRNGEKIQTPVGMIRGKNVLRRILDSKFDWKEDFFRGVTASQIMVEMTQGDWVQLESPLSKVIDIFGRTRFAFVPVIDTIKEYNTNKPTIRGTLSIRDFLPLIVNKKFISIMTKIEGLSMQDLISDSIGKWGFFNKRCYKHNGEQWYTKYRNTKQSSKLWK